MSLRSGDRRVGSRKITNTAAPLVPKTTQKPSQSGRGILLMAGGMFLFSAVDALAKYLTDTMHPFQIVWIRQLGLLSGALFLLAIHGRGLLKTAHPKLQIARGAVAAGSASLFIFGVSYVPLADAVAISFVAPFIVTLLGALVLRETVGIRRWSAVAIGFLGALIVLRPGTGIIHPAAILIIFAAAFFAFRQIISRKIAETDRTGTTVAYTALVASAILTIPLPFVWQWPTGPSQIALLTLMAVLAGFAEVLVIRALEVAHAVVVAPVQYTLLIWGTMYGFLVFHQLPDGWTWLGASIIVITGLYTLHRERTAKSQP